VVFKPFAGRRGGVLVVVVFLEDDIFPIKVVILQRLQEYVIEYAL